MLKLKSNQHQPSRKTLYRCPLLLLRSYLQAKVERTQHVLRSPCVVLCWLCYGFWKLGSSRCSLWIIAECEAAFDFWVFIYLGTLHRFYLVEKFQLPTMADDDDVHALLEAAYRNEKAVCILLSTAFTNNLFIFQPITVISSDNDKDRNGDRR